MKIFKISTIIGHILSSHIISSEVHNIVGSYKIMSKIGAQKKLIPLELNMENPFTCISSSQFSPHDSSSYIYEGNSSITINRNTIASKLFLDSFEIADEKITVENYTMHYITKEYGATSNSLGLAFTFKVDRYSLIYQLYHKNIIPSMNFGFMNNKIYFGGLPIDLNKNYFVGSCKVDNPYDRYTWGCSLSKFEIGGSYVYMSTHKSMFQSSHEYILAPIGGYQYIKKIVFPKYYNNNTCTLNEKNDEITCKCKDIQYFPIISFVFGRVYINVDKSMLFEKKYENCIFKIKPNHKDEFMWSFGSLLYKNYSILFDYKNQSISVYSPIENEISTIDISSHVLFTIKFNIIIMISDIILLIVLKKIILYY